MASIDAYNPHRSPGTRRTRSNRDASPPPPRRQSKASGVEDFLERIASRDRSQGRLSVAALTAGCCAAQLEAQCREVLVYRKQAPGPRDIDPLIAGLQRARSRLGALLHQALAMETASSLTHVLPDSCFEERFRKQLATEMMLTDFVVAGVRAASLIATIAKLARQVNRLRGEVRGGPPSERALLAAASMAVLDVIERAMRMSRVRDPRLRTEGFRALARLRPLCLMSSLDDDADQIEHTLRIEDRARWN